MSEQLCEIRLTMPDPMIAVGRAHNAKPYINPTFNETIHCEGSVVVCHVLQSSLPAFVDFLKTKGIV